ncbi:MAG: NAD(P)H-quinone oxidoreductase subunit 4 [Cyanobacteria bacterium P01_F01_bin.150]
MMTTPFPWLTTLILVPLVASLCVPLLPDKTGKRVRWFALGAGILDFVLMCAVFWNHYDPASTSFQLVETVPWLPQIGVNWQVSVDGISVFLVLLSGLVTTLSMLAAWRVDRRPKFFYALMLVLYAAQIGVFVAQDAMLFFVMWEVELVPVYLLISIWGGKNRRYAATKFIIYTALASIFILVAALAMAFYGDVTTFDMAELKLKSFPIGMEMLMYVGLLVAFGVKLAIFPFHTWLPDAHGEASSPVSMVLAGVLLKMGGYGLIRFNMELLPNAHVYFAPILIVLGVVNIIYGALNSFAQKNMKRRLAFSSISHMGFVLIGIASFSDLGMSGAMLQMISHGLIAAVLFFLAGVTYDRTHTMMMNQMGGMGIALPKVFALFTAGAMASLALPGMSGFVSEISVFVGLATSDVYSSIFRTVTISLAAIGLILTPVYLLSLLKEVFYGSSANLMCDVIPSCDINDKKLKRQGSQQAVCFGNSCELPAESTFDDASVREVFIAVSFLVLIIGVGFYPRVITDFYDVKTVAINTQMRSSQQQIAEDNPQIYANVLPSVPLEAKAAPLVGMID